MAHPVTIENDAIRMEVWPQIGGKISSIIDKADSHDLLFNYPAELPAAPAYDVPYGNGWYAGWDECFPAIATGPYPGHPYDGISIPDHGELWGIPVTTAVPNKNGITCVWNGLRFGYRLTRKLSLDGPALVAEYTLINLAPFEFRFVWGLHSLMSLTHPMTLDLPAHGQFRLSHDHAGTDIQEPFTWPMLSDGTDLSNLAGLPQKRGWKIFSQRRIDRPMQVRYPTRGRALTIEYSSSDDLPAYWGIWLNSGGWAGHHHVAVEPTTGRFDQLDRSISDESAGKIAPLARRQWTVRWSLA